MGREPAVFDKAYELADDLARPSGEVFLTGTRALVRILLDQRRLDRRDGRKTAGFVAGYRGSPLAGFDLALWRAAKFLDAEDIRFRPAVNEELAATAVMGSQQVETDPHRTVEGVFGLWYGKGPGADRAGDALKHGNAYGASPTGGVLAIVGDDHGCVSSSMSHQTDLALISWFMPAIHPASVAEYRDFGLWGYAASRFSGAWIGFKAISETVESSQAVTLGPLPRFATPTGFTPPEGGLHYRWPDLPGMQIEHRARAKLAALAAFARANPLDRLALGDDGARLGIVSSGKAHGDLMEALDKLGIDAARAGELGLAVYKVGLVWPLEAEGMRRFARGKRAILVVEEKRGLIEDQLKALFYDLPDGERPRLAGKDRISEVEELRPSLLLGLVADFLGLAVPSSPARSEIRLATTTKRIPYFCSGCPHNRSTLVPEGSESFGGIGCHFMASWMDRKTTTLTQMGGEGVHWVGRAPFVGDRHMFQNIGDGTWFHSGHIALRQAVAAGVNMTYKILYNDAVAMTGGQPVDGSLAVDQIARQVRDEGVRRIAVISDEPWKYRGAADFPEGASVHHRDELLEVERELRDIPGVTVLIYDQTCAAELRRRRKKGDCPDPPKRVFINERVCEGCGDCSVQSNCLSVVPLETDYGRKRQIEQSSCNKDYSCVEGFCPSFVTVEGTGMVHKTAAAALDEDRLAARLDALPEPTRTEQADLLVTGVGGTGVVTIGQIVAMAAHLEGKGASVLDFMGFAQKGGAVLSHVRIGRERAPERPVRIDAGGIDTLIACDIVVATQDEPLAGLRHGESRAIVNRATIPTADYVRDIRADLDYAGRLAALGEAAGKRAIAEVAATRIAERLLGDTVFANIFLLGFAWQQGAVPVSLAALLRAIELNGVAVATNRLALGLGRIAAVDPKFVESLADGRDEVDRPASLDEAVERRAAELVRYQDKALADDYRAFVGKVRIAGGERLAMAVAENLFKLTAYKDEYEVARLYTDGSFARRLGATFGGDFRLVFHLAPPLLARGKDAQGRPKKISFSGRWLLPLLRVLARMKGLRGTAFDPFGRHPDRKLERRLLADYRTTIEDLLAELPERDPEIALELARLPDRIRGYGPVKAANAEKAEAEKARLLERWRASRRRAA